MSNIFHNIDLFRIINEYTDLRSLCDTCSLFITLKKYINYILNKEYSLMYYDDILFRNTILNKIFNPIKQLHLDLSECLNLEDCNKIIDVSTLGNVHTLNLNNCNQITDVRSENVNLVKIL